LREESRKETHHLKKMKEKTKGGTGRDVMGQEKERETLPGETKRIYQVC